VHITDVRLLIYQRESWLTFSNKLATVEHAVLTISTDEGLEGHTFLSPPQPDVTRQLISMVKPQLLGRNPLDIGAIWAALGRRRDLDATVHSYVDVALWDIAGKVAALPVHRLLGTVRTAIPAYASSWLHDNARDYVEEALAYREQGFRGYKIHPPSMRGPHRQGAVTSAHINSDLTVYRDVRDAVGAEYVLFADPFASYTYAQALHVGRILEELTYEWFEDPLAPDDIYGYARLRQQLRIPLMATELVSGGLTGAAPWAAERVTDYLRGDVVLKGGITGLIKIAHLAEAFHLNCELHDAYNALNNLAVLHVALAIPNCDWYEVLVPHRPGVYDLENLSWGLVEPINVTADGMVQSPQRPGLGIDVDWELVRARTVAELR
jgi:L-alanine-DL-glutamate epimerase-like enolase superfamily enzyme